VQSIDKATIDSVMSREEEEQRVLFYCEIDRKRPTLMRMKGLVKV
jgi:hypothetical protein